MMDPDRLTSTLSDRYRIESEIDSGGMATVYRARDLNTRSACSGELTKAMVEPADRSPYMTLFQEVTNTLSVSQ